MGLGHIKLGLNCIHCLIGKKYILKYTKIDVGMSNVASKCHRDDPRFSQNRDGVTAIHFEREGDPSFPLDFTLYHSAWDGSGRQLNGVTGRTSRNRTYSLIFPPTSSAFFSRRGREMLLFSRISIKLIRFLSGVESMIKLISGCNCTIYLRPKQLVYHENYVIFMLFKFNGN